MTHVTNLWVTLGSVGLTVSPKTVPNLIRWFSTRKGERPTIVNHAKVYLTAGKAEEVLVQEATAKGIKTRRAVDADGPMPWDNLIIFSLPRIPEEFHLRKRASKAEGMRYPFHKLLLNALDGLLTKVPLVGKWFDRLRPFSWIGHLDPAHQCAQHVAWLLEFNFGKKSHELVTPDDLWDWMYDYSYPIWIGKNVAEAQERIRVAVTEWVKRSNGEMV